MDDDADDDDDSGDDDDDDDEEHDDKYSDHSRHHKYHRNILCISSSAWITIIVASVALQVVSDVPFGFYIRRKERMMVMMMMTVMMMTLASYSIGGIHTTIEQLLAHVRPLADDHEEDEERYHRSV